MAQVLRFVISMEIVRAIRVFVPWVWRALLSFVQFIAMCVFTFWRHVPETAGRMATVWWKRALDAHFPLEWSEQLYQVLWVLACALLFLAWVICAYITVTIFRLIF